MAADLKRRTVAAFATGVVCLGIAGCSEQPGVSSAATVPGTADSETTPHDPPSSRSGDLGLEHLPKPDDLGPGWEYRIDHGNAEDGYLGSGEPATAREPDSVLAAITPLGCRPATLPPPDSALEVTYARGDVPGVGLLLRFADETSARRFFSTHARALERCVGSRHIDIDVYQRDESLIVTTRTEHLGETPTWVEGMGHRGTDVMLLAVADPTKRSVQSVVAALT
jgi:hypothetical protein